MKRIFMFHRHSSQHISEHRLAYFAAPEVPDPKITELADKVKATEGPKAAEYLVIKGNIVRQIDDKLATISDYAKEELKKLGIPEEDLKVLTSAEKVVQLAKQLGWVVIAAPPEAGPGLDLTDMERAEFDVNMIVMPSGIKIPLGTLVNDLQSLTPTPENIVRFEKGWGLIAKWLRDRVEPIKNTLITRDPVTKRILPITPEVKEVRDEFLLLIDSLISLQQKAADMRLIPLEEKRKFESLKGRMLSEFRALPTRRIRGTYKLNVSLVRGSLDAIASAADYNSYVVAGEDLKTSAYDFTTKQIRPVYANRTGMKRAYHDHMTDEEKGVGQETNVGIMGADGIIRPARPWMKFNYATAMPDYGRRPGDRGRGGRGGRGSFNAGGSGRSEYSPEVGGNPNMRVAILISEIAELTKQGRMSLTVPRYEELDQLLKGQSARFTITVRGDARIGERANAQPLIDYYTDLARRGVATVQPPPDNIQLYGPGTSRDLNFKAASKNVEAEKKVRAAEELRVKVLGEVSDSKSKYPKGWRLLDKVAKENVMNKKSSYYFNFLGDLMLLEGGKGSENFKINLVDRVSVIWDKNVKPFIIQLENHDETKDLPEGLKR